MTWSVLQLGSEGAVNTRAPRLGVVGVLSIDYLMDGRTGYPRKTARVVALAGPAIEQDLLCPLLDPEILRLDRNGMFLRGKQPSQTGGGEKVQVWRCQHLQADC